MPENLIAGFPELEAMNILQDFNVISDNAVWWADVAEIDRPRAIDFLTSYAKQERRKTQRSEATVQ